ncbi:MAG TPA: hypothetical protein VIP77_00295 [Jiangellaceae bacterium]
MHSNASDPGLIRAALQVTLSSRRRFDMNLLDIVKASRRSLTTMATALDDAGQRNLATELAVRSTTVGRDMPTTVAGAVYALDRQAHDLLQVLARLHGQPDIGRFTPGRANALGKGPDPTRFGSGWAGRYAAGIIQDLPTSTFMSKAALRLLPSIDKWQIEASKDAIIALVSERHRNRARALLTSSGSHAVEFHGSHVPDELLIARTAWTRPADHGSRKRPRWSIEDDGRVRTASAESTTMSSKFVTPEAFARSLEALLEAADSYPGELEGMLTDNAVGGRATISIPASKVGLGPGDTHGYRPAGVRSRESREDWVLARDEAMEPDASCGPPVFVKPVDPVAESRAPAVSYAFKKIHESGRSRWHLITMFAS